MRRRWPSYVRKKRRVGSRSRRHEDLVWCVGSVLCATATIVFVAPAELGFLWQSPPHGCQPLLPTNLPGTANNGNPVDSNTPTNFASEISGDIDYGSNNPTIMPELPGSTVAHVVLMCGKDAQMRLLNANTLNGHNCPGFTRGDLSYTPLPQF